jgi:hypothetical protein
MFPLQNSNGDCPGCLASGPGPSHFQILGVKTTATVNLYSRMEDEASNSGGSISESAEEPRFPSRSRKGNSLFDDFEVCTDKDSPSSLTREPPP